MAFHALFTREAASVFLVAIVLKFSFAAGAAAVWNPACFNRWYSRWCNRDPETGLPNHYEAFPQRLQCLEPNALNRIQTRCIGLVLMPISLCMLSAILPGNTGWLHSWVQRLNRATGLPFIIQVFGMWMIGLCYLTFGHTRLMRRLQRREFLPRTEEEHRQRMVKERNTFMLFFEVELLIACRIA